MNNMSQIDGRVPRSAKSSKDFPTSPSEETLNSLDSLLASFPKPLNWDDPDLDLDTTLFCSDEHSNDSQRSKVSIASSTLLPVSQSNDPFSPVKPSVPIKDEPIPPTLLLQSLTKFKSKKRPTEPNTPTRPFKRLREALTLSPRSPKRPQSTKARPSCTSDLPSPAKIPLPPSPFRKSLPPQPDGIDDLLIAFRSTQTYLNRSVDALELLSHEIRDERAEAAVGRLINQSLVEEGKQYTIKSSDLQRQVESLNAELKRIKDDAGKAARESQGMITHLEMYLAGERARNSKLQEQVDQLQSRTQVIEHNTDRRVFELQQELDSAQQEVARAKGTVADMRSQLDEAEFAHRALKEGGARLARELLEKGKKVEELEKGKGSGKRWGMI